MLVGGPWHSYLSAWGTRALVGGNASIKSVLALIALPTGLISLSLRKALMSRVSVFLVLSAYSWANLGVSVIASRIRTGFAS